MYCRSGGRWRGGGRWKVGSRSRTGGPSRAGRARGPEEPEEAWLPPPADEWACETKGETGIGEGIGLDRTVVERSASVSKRREFVIFASSTVVLIVLVMLFSPVFIGSNT